MKPHAAHRTSLITNFLVLLALFSNSLIFGQDLPTNDLSPDGILDNVFDRYGVQYKLNDLMINAEDLTLSNR